MAKVKKLWKKYGKGTMSLKQFINKLKNDRNYRQYIRDIGPSEFGVVNNLVGSMF